MKLGVSSVCEKEHILIKACRSVPLHRCEMIHWALSTNNILKRKMC